MPITRWDCKGSAALAKPMKNPNRHSAIQITGENGLMSLILVKDDFGVNG
jgi:hypothetical protein